MLPTAHDGASGSARPGAGTETIDRSRGVRARATPADRHRAPHGYRPAGVPMSRSFSAEGCGRSAARAQRDRSTSVLRSWHSRLTWPWRYRLYPAPAPGRPRAAWRRPARCPAPAPPCAALRPCHAQVVGRHAPRGRPPDMPMSTTCWPSPSTSSGHTPWDSTARADPHPQPPAEPVPAEPEHGPRASGRASPACGRGEHRWRIVFAQVSPPAMRPEVRASPWQGVRARPSATDLVSGGDAAARSC